MSTCVYILYYSFKILFDVVILTFNVVTNSTPLFKPYTYRLPLVYRRIIDTYYIMYDDFCQMLNFDIQWNEIFHAG